MYHNSPSLHGVFVAYVIVEVTTRESDFFHTKSCCSSHICDIYCGIYYINMITWH
jgi:hypothetical protein